MITAACATVIRETPDVGPGEFTRRSIASQRAILKIISEDAAECSPVDRRQQPSVPSARSATLRPAECLNYTAMCLVHRTYCSAKADERPCRIEFVMSAIRRDDWSGTSTTGTARTSSSGRTARSLEAWARLEKARGFGEIRWRRGERARILR